MRSSALAHFTFEAAHLLDGALAQGPQLLQRPLEFALQVAAARAQAFAVALGQAAIVVVGQDQTVALRQKIKAAFAPLDECQSLRLGALAQLVQRIVDGGAEFLFDGVAPLAIDPRWRTGPA